MPSFDIVSKVDMQEVDNAVTQAVKEIGQRYDFKGSKSQITQEKDAVKILADDDYKLKAVIDVLQSKFLKRNISIKALQYGKVEPASGGLVRQTITVQQGICQAEFRFAWRQFAHPDVAVANGISVVLEGDWKFLGVSAERGPLKPSGFAN